MQADAHKCFLGLAVSPFSPLIRSSQNAFTAGNKSTVIGLFVIPNHRRDNQRHKRQKADDSHDDSEGGGDHIVGS